MSELHALVIEDEWPARNYLVELLGETGAFREIMAVSTVEEAHDVMRSGEVDVAFVDIRLVDVPGDTSGLGFARSLGLLEAPPMLILVTAFTEHALEGYEVGAIDYLLKPLSARRVRACVEKVCRLMPTSEPKPVPTRVAARHRRDLVFLELGEILAFESLERLTYVHHPDGVYGLDLSLTALEASLGEGVLRVHRSWLVMCEQVQSLSRTDMGSVLQVGGELTVPVSRERVSAVRRALLERTVGLRGT